MLLRHLPGDLFDADKSAHRLLAEDGGVHAALRRAFGPSVFAADGLPDRRLLRERVFVDDDARRNLESILHPAIRAEWSILAVEARSSKNWHCFDIPLLYETEVEAHFDHVVVVACSPVTQRQRLCATRGLSEELAAKMIAAQLDLRVKITRSDHLIWNDSTPASLEGQTTLLSRWLRLRYG